MPSPTVVLPSIHEMFPDYLLAAKPPSASAPAANTAAAPQPPPPAPFLGGLPPRNHYLPAPMPPPLTLRFAFDAHPPSSPSTSPTLLRSPTSTGSTVADGDRDGDSAESASDGQLSNEDDDDDDDGSSSPTSTRKHICPQCGKRFNRPSSLRIHVNTHTGATPFRCPYPNCGRAFNVNSNMRRHYRNHSAALSAAAGAVAARPGSSCASTFSACSTADSPCRTPISLGHRTTAPSSSSATGSPRVHPYQLRGHAASGGSSPNEKGNRPVTPPRNEREVRFPPPYSSFQREANWPPSREALGLRPASWVRDTSNAPGT